MARRHADDVARLELGRKLREAQNELAGDVLPELTAQSRATVRKLTKRARAVAEDLGTPLSESVTHQVEQTLRALPVDAQLCGFLVRVWSDRHPLDQR